MVRLDFGRQFSMSVFPSIVLVVLSKGMMQVSVDLIKLRRSCVLREGRNWVMLMKGWWRGEGLVMVL